MAECTWAKLFCELILELHSSSAVVYTNLEWYEYRNVF